MQRSVMNSRASFVSSTASATVLALSAATAGAQEFPGFHVGLGAGHTHASGTASDDVSTLTRPTIDGMPYDADDVAWTAFVGYDITPHFSLEGGYWNLGTLDGQPAPCGRFAELDVSQLYLRANARYALPVLPALAVTAYAGVGRSFYDVDSGNSFQPAGVICPAIALPDYESPGDETSLVWGAGLDWTMNDRFTLRAAYGNHDTDVQDLSTVSLSLRYAFATR